MKKSEAVLYRQLINKTINALSDEEALEVTELFLPWKVNKEYKINDKIKFNGNLYSCIQPHTSQDDWVPNLTPALWKKVSIEEWPEWEPPTGAHDAYAIGAKVTHNEKRWINDIDNNIWEPGVYGWSEVINA